MKKHAMTLVSIMWLLIVIGAMIDRDSLQVPAIAFGYMGAMVWMCGFHTIIQDWSRDA